MWVVIPDGTDTDFERAEVVAEASKQVEFVVGVLCEGSIPATEVQAEAFGEWDAEIDACPDEIFTIIESTEDIVSVVTEADFSTNA